MVFSHAHTIEDRAKTWKITWFIHTDNTHFKWERVIRAIDVFVKNTKKCHLTLAEARYYTWKYSLFWHEVYEALYDLVAGMSMLTVKQKSCSKNKQIMRLGQKLCFVFFLISFLQISSCLGYQYQLCWVVHVSEVSHRIKMKKMSS